jgi:hypothetical protein
MKAWATAAVTLSILLAACGSSGQSTSTAGQAGTGKNPYLLISIKNDTSATVHFIQCKATCAELHERRTLPAGGTNSILGSNENLPFTYLVEDEAGKRIGCVYMQFDHLKSAPPVLISSMKPCKE